MMIKVLPIFLACLSLPAFGQQDVNFTGDFESGRIQSSSSSKDGFFIHTLPNPQSGTSNVSSARGGFGPEVASDTKVIKQESVGSQTVRPRKGGFFLRSALYFNKNYQGLNSGKNKARSKIYMSSANNKVDFDEEGYLGFSIFLPKNWEHETGVRGNRGSAQLLQVQSSGASSTLMYLSVHVPKGTSVAHWILAHNLSDTSVRAGQKKVVYDLGPVTGDLGKWTDFVLRYRFNPFSKRTNASNFGGMNKTYEGNRGILQLWKSSGSPDGNGNRKMTITSANSVNRPVGLVPHRTQKIGWHFRVYKYGWHNNPTDVAGPVWVGFDEIRDGRVREDGTAFSDVHPGGLACPGACSNSVTAGQPLAPSEFEIVN